MSVAARPLFAFDNTFARELEGLYEPWQGRKLERPVTLVVKVTGSPETDDGNEGVRLAVTCAAFTTWERLSLLVAKLPSPL